MQMVLRLILPVALSFGLLLPEWAPASEDATASEGTASEPSAYTVPVFVPAAESIRVEAVLNSNDPAAMTRVVSLMYLMPPLTALMSWALFNEQLAPLAIVGMAVCVAGVALVNWSGGRA